METKHPIFGGIEESETVCTPKAEAHSHPVMRNEQQSSTCASAAAGMAVAHGEKLFNSEAAPSDRPTGQSESMPTPEISDASTAGQIPAISKQEEAKLRGFGGPPKHRTVGKTTVDEPMWKPLPPPPPQPPSTLSPISLISLWQKAGWVLIALLVLATGLVLLFVGSQAIAFINLLAQSPVWMQWLGGTALTCCLLAIAGSTGVLIVRYLRFQITPAIWLDRSEIPRPTTREALEAQQTLHGWLADYELPQDTHTQWERLGFTANQLKSLRQTREDLLNPRHGLAVSWIQQCDALFLAALDDIANQRIRRYAQMVGIKTAIAPAGLLDSTIVLVNSYLLLSDLCEIYRVRAGRLGTLRLLLRITLDTIVSGNLDQTTDSIGDSMRDSISEWTGTLVAKGVGMVAAKAAEGGANALLILRLGRAAIRELRPLRK